MTDQPIRPYPIGGGGGPVTAPLSVDPASPYFLRDGGIWIWTGLTAFTLLKRYLTGRVPEAQQFMDWAASLGVNLLRVFAQVDWTGPPNKGVEPGFLPGSFPDYDQVAATLFADAAARGLAVEFVAHTFGYALSPMVEHLARCDRLVQAAPNAVLELANEPMVNDVPLNEILARYTPRSLWTTGQYGADVYPQGRWLNDHPPRDDQFARKFKGAWEYHEGDGPEAPFSPPWKGPVVFDEPKRLEDAATPDDWMAFGAGSAFFAAGVTGHSLALQKCEVLTGDPLARLQALLAGVRAVPVQRYASYQHPDDQGSLRRYRRIGEDGRTYEISVRPFAFGPV